MNPIVDVDIRDFTNKADANSYLKLLRSQFYLLQQTNSAWLLYTTSEAIGKDCYPLAAVVAACFERISTEAIFSWVGYVNDQLAVVAIRNGLPYSSEKVNLLDLGAHLQQLNNRLQIESMQVFGDDRVHVELADGLNLADEIVNSAQFERYVSADYQFKKYRSNKLAIPLGVVLLLGLGAVGFDKYGRALLRKPEVKVTAPAVIQRDYAAEYDKAVSDILATAATPKSRYAAEIETYFKSTDIGHDGWVISEINCGLSQCVETFSNKNGTQAGMKNDIDSARFPEQEKGEAITLFSVKNEQILRASLPTVVDFSRDFISSVQQIQVVSKVQVRIDAPTVIGGSQDLPINQVPADRYVRSGQFELTGPLGALDLALDRLPLNVGIESLKLTGLQTSDIKFTLNGAYYAK